MRRGGILALAVMIGLIGCALVAGAPAALSTTPKWKISPSPDPPGSSGGGLGGVSCPAADSCFAVGYYSAGSVRTSLVERWNGGAWKIMANPNPPGSTSISLAGISCPAANRCFAVGDAFAGSTEKTLVERWNGSSWKIIASPSPPGSGGGLGAVSCPTVRSCFAVGIKLGRSLVEHWNGSSWKIVTNPSPSGSTGTTLSGVSCPLVNSCFAVGAYSVPGPTEGAGKSLVEHWNGRTWSIIASPNPGGETYTSLSGVSCPLVNSCYAVGLGETFYGSKSVIEHWDGSVWKIMAAPTSSAFGAAFLSGVSCPSANICFAVGATDNRSRVERWNGSVWSIVPGPTPADTNTELFSVSCPVATSCFAVGDEFVFATTKLKPLVERSA